MLSSTSVPKDPPPSRGQKFWAVLLVLDAFFVIIFGGALAAKLYQHWESPLMAPPPAAQRRPPKPREPAKTEVAKAPEPPKAPEAAKPPEPKAPAAPAAKPSMVSQAPQPHEAAKPQAPAREAAKKEQAAAPQAAPGKAVPVEFHLKAPKAQSVELAGAFLVRGGGKKAMVKHSDGVWTLSLYLTPNTYRYRFIVDGKKKPDPENPKMDRGSSVISVP